MAVKFSIFHETAFGQLARICSGGRLFQSREHRPDFVNPYTTSSEKPRRTDSEDDQQTLAGQQSPVGSNNEAGKDKNAPPPTSKEDGGEQGTTVTWYGDDDPENPLNWSLPRKIFVTAVICVLTSTIYMGSSIFSPAVQIYSEEQGVGQSVSALGITLFVWGYGLGPLVMSPITEISMIGRNWPYVISIGLFVILQVPSVLIDSVAGFMILRFLAGFVGSPVLATGGATVGDIWGMGPAFANALACWGYSASVGPVLGPLVGGFAVQANGWRWSIWPLLWGSGGMWLVIFFFLPETSGQTILSHRAARLRKLTGNKDLLSEGDRNDRSITPRALAFETLVRPIQLGFFEPVVFFNNMYIALIYGVLYSFFECFPIVFEQQHGFNLGEGGLAFLGLFVGSSITLVFYCLFNKWFVAPRLGTDRWKSEYRQLPVMLGSIVFPVSLFWFAWTSMPQVHWISPIIASGFFSVAVFVLFQGILSYLAEGYPRYAASVFASNDLMRSAVAGAFPLFSTQMFNKLTVQGGVSLLAGLATVMLPLPWLLYKFGPRLRAASKKAGM